MEYVLRHFTLYHARILLELECTRYYRDVLTEWSLVSMISNHLPFTAVGLNPTRFFGFVRCRTIYVTELTSICHTYIRSHLSQLSVCAIYVSAFWYIKCLTVYVNILHSTPIFIILVAIVSYSSSNLPLLMSVIHHLHHQQQQQQQQQ